MIVPTSLPVIFLDILPQIVRGFHGIGRRKITMPSSILLWSTPALTPIWPNASSERMNGCSMMISVEASSTAWTNLGILPVQVPEPNGPVPRA